MTNDRNNLTTLPAAPDRICYCDNAAAMPPSPAVLDYAREMQSKWYFNQESIHRGSHDLRRELEKAAAELVFSLTGSDEYDVVWGYTGTGVINTFFQLAAGGGPVLTDPLEHPSVLAAARRGAKSVTMLPCDGAGLLRPQIPPFPRGVAAFHQVQSELGTLQNADALFAELPPGVVRFCDAIQGAGKLPLPRTADVLAVSGVKFGAPGGAALLVSKRWTGRERFLSQAEQLRKEHLTERVQPALLLTLVFAAKCAVKVQAERLAATRAFNRELRAKLETAFPPALLRCTVPEEAASPYILHLQLPGKQGAVVVRALAERGVLAASGSACAAESKEPSPAITAIGWKKKEAFSGLRFSFGEPPLPETADFLVKTIGLVLKNY